MCVCVISCSICRITGDDVGSSTQISGGQAEEPEIVANRSFLVSV